ncbi:MAG: hypothetical protein AAF211_21905 [Myxococcota bacterium]
MLLAWTMGLASASTYEIDFYIKSAAPTKRPSIGRQFTYDVGPGWPDVAVTSDWSYVTCEHQAGIVRMVFEATATNWPSTWPSTVSCSALGYTLKANILDLPLTDDYPVAVDINAGLDIELAPGTYFWRSFELPSSHSFALGAVDADLGGSSWTDVKCVVFDRGPTLQILRIEVLPNHVAGSGTCPLPLTAGGHHLVPVEITH